MSSYTVRLDNKIYTNQGDLVGELYEDESPKRHLEAVKALIEGEGEDGLDSNDQDILDYFEDEKLELDLVKEAVGLRKEYEKSISNFDEVLEGLSELQDRILLDNLGEDDWDFIQAIVEKAKGVKLPGKKKTRKAKA